MQDITSHSTTPPIRASDNLISCTEPEFDQCGAVIKISFKKKISSVTFEYVSFHNENQFEMCLKSIVPFLCG